jgi:hypothetical protein
MIGRLRRIKHNLEDNIKMKVVYEAVVLVGYILGYSGVML